MYILLTSTHLITVRFIRPCLKVITQEHAISSKTEQDLKKKFRYSNLIKVIAHEEAKTQVASLQKELFQIAHLKTLTTKCQIIFSYPY